MLSIISILVNIIANNNYVVDVLMLLSQIAFVYSVIHSFRVFI